MNNIIFHLWNINDFKFPLAYVHTRTHTYTMIKGNYLALNSPSKEKSLLLVCKSSTLPGSYTERSLFWGGTSCSSKKTNIKKLHLQWASSFFPGSHKPQQAHWHIQIKPRKATMNENWNPWKWLKSIIDYVHMGRYFRAIYQCRHQFSQRHDKYRNRKGTYLFTNPSGKKLERE